MIKNWNVGEKYAYDLMNSFFENGGIDDYKYSNAMIAYGKEWSFEEMNAYLIKPQAYIRGTKMAFAGLRKEKDRASVILYMNSKSSSPKPLP